MQCTRHLSEITFTKYAQGQKIAIYSIVCILMRLHFASNPIRKVDQNLHPIRNSCQNMFPMRNNYQNMHPIRYSYQNLCPIMHSYHNLCPIMYSYHNLCPFRHSYQNMYPIRDSNKNIYPIQRRHDTLVSYANISMLRNMKSASIYRYTMRVTLSNFQCFAKPITAFTDD